MQPVIMLVVSGIFMFAVIGGISLMSHYYTLNGIKNRTVGDGQHGTARFAGKKEIKETYIGCSTSRNDGERVKTCQKRRDLC